MGIAIAAAFLLAQSAGAVNDPAGSSLSPWVVLPGDDIPGKQGRVALDGHRIFNQRAVPARAVRTDAPLAFDGVTLPAGSVLALAVKTSTKAEAWCALPRPGGTELTFRSPWGKRETRCFADTDADGRLDSGYFGKFDLLGLPSVRTIKNRAALTQPVAFAETDRSSIPGFHVKATIFYLDLRKNGRSPCWSLVPFHLDKSGADPARRRLAVALTRDDGTACYSQQTEMLRPAGDGQLPAQPGQVLSFGGASLRIDRITPTEVEFTMLTAFDPYVVASRTSTMVVDY